MLNTFRARNNCEQEAKFVQDRIVSVERTIGELCHVFGQYSRKAARLRDKGDEIAKVTLEHAEAEQLNRSLSLALENFADCISLLSSYGDLRVQNLDSKVIKEFARYEDICKHAKDEVKQIYNAREKEIARKRQLDRIKERNPRNRQQIIQAETELVKASAEFSKTLRNLEEKSTEFERQKLHDVKSILLDFVAIEMGYHARALEVLTNAYKAVNSMDEEADLQDFQKTSGKVEAEFKKSLRRPDSSRNVGSRSLFRSSNSLGSLKGLFTPNNKKPEGIPRKASKSEETLDSMKRSISDTEDSLSDSANVSENVSDTEEPSSPIRPRKPRK
ncbi:CBY1-interacting BAR domain-containing protein 1 isoform X1 [Tribolium castaneum]|uniref:Protein FAM92A1-like Protein n=1 Tax=Tribolium castaneum TaxID=7070 RepID=D6WM63_TRICA|nr:PREDICTED: protein FAM92A1 isoform X1 [Tribolium castaneum]EFA03352.2 Protein FAM92A1-like Protein [Tribolium castaneum]|eukprot:XP_008193363.1 PREDICTED: protein FAM92A1 isoform X1 [Tribolium castaneum]